MFSVLTHRLAVFLVFYDAMFGDLARGPPTYLKYRNFACMGCTFLQKIHSNRGCVLYSKLEI